MRIPNKRFGISVMLVAILFSAIFASSCAEKEEPKNSNAAPASSSSPGTPTSSAPPASANSNAAPPAAAGKEIQTPSGLKYTDLVIGTAPSPKTGQQVSVHDTGTLTNGRKFDSARDRGQPYEFRIGMGSVIKGWDEGLMSMKVGGKRKLVIPPALGYGAQGFPPAIPPNATLLFDVELVG